jgi:asparagine synthase (glutamine-hydrolysing)
MCGIAGIIKKSGPLHENELVSMTDSLRHRGPDGSGYHFHEHVGIGHRRLSIIDLEGGKQPLCNEDKTIWITFNGEIYNYPELKKQLQQAGHRFQTNSDTEVIVHAYEEWGTNCVKKLRGMFAFAICDQRKRELFLARDHFGIKPLVYGFTKECFCFASELQAIRLAPGFESAIDLNALDLYLQFQYIPAPHSIYKNVYKLPPAHFMRVNFDGTPVECQSYWQLEYKTNHNSSKAQWLDEFDSVLKESVKAHLLSDVPFGAFLSGGIDSSAIVTYMAQEMKQPVKTFSIGFHEKAYNELDYARLVAKHWGTEHHEEIVVPDALAILPDLVTHYGEPFGDSSAIPTWYVSRLARQHVTMVLTGDAGDEIFIGYDFYTNRWNRHLSPVPEHLPGYKKLLYPLLNKVNPKRFPYRTSTTSDWFRYKKFFHDDYRNAFWLSEFHHEIQSDNSGFIQDLFIEYGRVGHFQKGAAIDFRNYLPNDILAKVDIASMMHSLETRTPLLDLKVVEFAATLPQELCINKINGKWEGKLILKKY